MFKGALMCFRNNVMLHAAWQNEITLSYNPSSIQVIDNDVYSNNINIILIQ